MALVSISEAARLTGKSRATIHRRAKAGKLSIQGSKVDTSELIRVFGPLLSTSEQVTVQSNKKSTANNTDVLQELNTLKVQAAHDKEILELKLSNAIKELSFKDEINESLKDQIRLLEHKPSEQSEPIKTTNTEQLKADIRNDVKKEREKEGRLTKLGRLLFDA
jgi:hypothetical protein